MSNVLKNKCFIILSLWYYSAWFIGLVDKQLSMNPLYLAAFIFGNALLLTAIVLIKAKRDQSAMQLKQHEY